MKYNLEYLPIAEKDIRGAAMYIALELQAPVAAVKLVRLIRKRTDDLRDMPYMYHEYYGRLLSLSRSLWLRLSGSVLTSRSYFGSRLLCPRSLALSDYSILYMYPYVY